MGASKWMVALARGAGAWRPVGARRLDVWAALPDDAPLAAAQGRAPRPARADAVLEVFGDAAPALLPAGSHAYRVEEVVHWDDPRAPGDGGDEGDDGGDVVVFFFVRRRRDLAPEEFARRYREGHAPLARVHHPGIRRYVQNHVVEAGPGAPDWHAVAQLHFASERDLRERFYRDAQSPAAIAADVARFADTGSGLVLVTRRAAPAGDRA